MAKDEVESGACRRLPVMAAVVATREAVPQASEPERGERERKWSRTDSIARPTLQLIAERALALTRATGAAIALSAGQRQRDDLRGQRRRRCSACLAPGLQVGSGFSGECVRTGRSLRCDDSETDDRVDREGCKSLGIRSMVAVPIRPGSKVTGLLEVFSPQPYAFNANDISALQHLTGSILPRPGAQVPSGPRLCGTGRRFRAAAFTADIRQRPSRPPAGRGCALVSAARPVTAVDRPSGQHSHWHKSSSRGRDRNFCFCGAMADCALDLKPDALGSSRLTQAQRSGRKLPKSPNLRRANANDLASLRKVAEQGDPAAQFALGRALCHRGRGQTGLHRGGDAGSLMAAEQGHILAQATLGAYYWAGRGVPQDLTKAYYWSVLAQAGGDQASKYRVAVLASRMSRSQVLAAQQQANDWLQ